jgi:hypothetical protein
VSKKKAYKPPPKKAKKMQGRYSFTKAKKARSKRRANNKLPSAVKSKKQRGGSR